MVFAIALRFGTSAAVFATAVFFAGMRFVLVLVLLIVGFVFHFFTPYLLKIRLFFSVDG